MDPLFKYSAAWASGLEDRIANIRLLYDHDPEAAHGEQDELVREYISRRAAHDDQEAIELLALVGDMSLTRWFA